MFRIILIHSKKQKFTSQKSFETGNLQQSEKTNKMPPNYSLSTL